jgi:class 3 adenylate cyclase
MGSAHPAFFCGEGDEAADNVLKHRVGIHLGDVFMRANDVMGDGVNIAARLQAQAPAGGICISQVVYDVVKSKMTLNVVRLEERKLKNIKENIPMYHVRLEERTAAATAVAPRPYTPSKRVAAP